MVVHDVGKRARLGPRNARSAWPPSSRRGLALVVALGGLIALRRTGLVAWTRHVDDGAQLTEKAAVEQGSESRGKAWVRERRFCSKISNWRFVPSRFLRWRCKARLTQL